MSMVTDAPAIIDREVVFAIEHSESEPVIAVALREADTGDVNNDRPIAVVSVTKHTPATTAAHRHPRMLTPWSRMSMRDGSCW